MQSPLLSAAVQDRFAAGLYHSSKNMKICCSYRCAVTQHQCTATLFRAKCSPHCSVLLCKTGLQQACITAITPMKICSSYRCAVTQHQCTATLFFAKCSLHCLVLLCKTGLQQACITAITPMKICSSYRCAVTQHQCTATLFRAKCSPHCSVLLCKTGLQQACITAITPMKMCSLYRCAVTQHQCTATLFREKCSPHCLVLLCKTGLQQACITAITPMKSCSSYRCAVTQHQCTATLFLAKSSHHCQVLLYAKQVAAGLCHSKYTCGDLLFIQLCNDPSPVHCNTVLGKKQSPLSSAAVCKTGCQQACISASTPVEICCSYSCAMTHDQCTATLFLAKAVTTVLCCCMQNRLPAGLYQCKYTCGDLLFIQLCNDPAPVHCNTSWQTAVTTVQCCCMQNRLPAGLCQCKYTCGDLLFIQLCNDPAPVHCNTVLGKKQSPLSSAAVGKTGCQQACVTANTPVEICCSYSCAMTHHKCTATLFLAKAVTTVQCCCMQNRLPAGLYQCKYTCGDLLFIQLCNDPAPVHCNTVLGKSSHHCPVLLYAKQVASRLVSVQIHLWRFAVHTAVQ